MQGNAGSGQASVRLVPSGKFSQAFHEARLLWTRYLLEYIEVGVKFSGWALPQLWCQRIWIGCFGASVAPAHYAGYPIWAKRFACQEQDMDLAGQQERNGLYWKRLCMQPPKVQSICAVLTGGSNCSATKRGAKQMLFSGCEVCE